jgi:hypothetical protein
MATTEHQTTSPHKRSSALARLDRGFDSLTLDPSPHLRQSRKLLQVSNTPESAWRRWAGRSPQR